MWDNIGTVHNAVGDYGPEEHRYMRRVQVMATLDYARWPPEMKLVTYEAEGTTRIGAVLGEAVIALQPALDAACAAAGEAPQYLPETMLGLLQAGEAKLVAAARALAFAARPESVGLRRPLAAVRLAAPLQPGKILGVGRNYADHAKEVGGPKLTAPRIFLKPTSSVCGPGSAVAIPAAALKPDWEVELAVVIGRPPGR